MLGGITHLVENHHFWTVVAKKEGFPKRWGLKARSHVDGPVQNVHMGVIHVQGEKRLVAFFFG